MQVIEKFFKYVLAVAFVMIGCCFIVSADGVDASEMIAHDSAAIQEGGFIDMKRFKAALKSIANAGQKEEQAPVVATPVQFSKKCQISDEPVAVDHAEEIDDRGDTVESALMEVPVAVNTALDGVREEFGTELTAIRSDVKAIEAEQRDAAVAHENTMKSVLTEMPTVINAKLQSVREEFDTELSAIRSNVEAIEAEQNDAAVAHDNKMESVLTEMPTVINTALNGVRKEFSLELKNIRSKVETMGVNNKAIERKAERTQSELTSVKSEREAADLENKIDAMAEKLDLKISQTQRSLEKALARIDNRVESVAKQQKQVLKNAIKLKKSYVKEKVRREIADEVIKQHLEVD